MAIKIYNTMTRQKEKLVPRTSGEISMYVCGLTVYNYMHIGNARTFVNFDVIRRYLEYRGFKVEFVRNITDIDDKIINRAALEGTGTAEIAQKYEAAFRTDTEMLGVKDPTIEPRATETIPEMIKLVEDLIAVDLAYAAEGNVWFRVARFKGYGKLSRRTLKDMKAGERVEPDPSKEDPMDFALWKAAKAGEPAWESPWGPGRPGWHLECSAMSLKYLGHGFDIHGGAVDLIFPHHENEIAQSEGATGKPFVTYWVHGGLLNIDQEKMSKSLGNVMLVSELLKQWSPMVVRMFMLGTLYRNPLDFTKEGLVQAQANIERLERTLQNIDFALDQPLATGRRQTVGLLETLSECRAHFIQAMDDDFNTAEALPALFRLVKEVNTLIEGAQELPTPEALKQAKETIIELTEAFGLGLGYEVDWLAIEAPIRDLARATIGLIPGDISREGVLNALLERREEARREQDWGMADTIRNSLLEIGIEVEDTASGPRWKPVLS